jgi:hypothetical protein
MAFFTDFILYKLFKLPKETTVWLGTKKRKGAMVATIYIEPLWKRLPLAKKIHAVMKMSWEPDEQTIGNEAMEIFSRIFGEIADYGPVVYKLFQWHQSRDWQIENVTDQDIEKAHALVALAVLNQTQLAKIGSNHLNLKMAERSPLMCTLTHGMIVKIPVVSMQHYLDIDAEFTFNSIRKAGHPNADELIAYIYEIIFIQHKLFDCLLSYLKLFQQVKDHKGESSLMIEEFKMIKEADVAITYLKASIEKTVALLAGIYGITGLDQKKMHKQRLSLLDRDLPDAIKNVPYFGFVWHFISSENLEELNKYRTGLLHKRGISDLQPHKYVEIKVPDLPLGKMYAVLYEQHATNTAVLLGVLALLTDELVKMDKPDVNFWDIPSPEPHEVPDNFFAVISDQLE